MGKRRVAPLVGHQSEGVSEVKLKGLRAAHKAPMRERTPRAPAVVAPLKHETRRCQDTAEDRRALCNARDLLLSDHPLMLPDTGGCARRLGERC
jgi:hypothetical protein